MKELPDVDKKQALIGYIVDLKAMRFCVRDIILKNNPTSAIVFYLNGEPYSYVNHCMHMQRPLNCQEDTIFDESKQFLRCSMHGFLFDPKTGECQSPVCFGQKLQSLRVKERDDKLYFVEKHLLLARTPS